MSEMDVPLVERRLPRTTRNHTYAPNHKLSKLATLLVDTALYSLTLLSWSEPVTAML